MENLVQAFILPQAHNAPNKGKALLSKGLDCIFSRQTLYILCTQ